MNERVRKFITAAPTPNQLDVALLALRIGIAGSLFVNHGWEKLTGFQHMVDAFQMDPIHIGIYPTMVIATVSDGVCSLLVVAGLCTRLAACYICANLLVVLIFMQDIFGFVHPRIPVMRDMPPPAPGHTELTYMYLVFFAVFAFVGAGRLSIDQKVIRSRSL